ncbi:alpha-hydroxy acid oxidase [Sediminivirga luteola]|uniref:alpha-hydroxy acid oxidase n=1 Tax=Sediminivirga luteola TaxID=1774748 RepID=UPI001F57E533|nr:alpha-hydroxy acid oxidase [Sediminivirga luteola]MCI2265235.1 alpha-hydroxy-acid oxidizing protein [Sediminivirga luteola]
MIAFEERNRVPSVDWDDVRRIRDAWPGKLVIKGIMNADDARTAVHDIGADALYVSNHGGRQLDSQPATIEALPRIRAAVEGKAEVYLDGGVRRGEDALKALALGARAVGLARPVAYGLAAAGQKGGGRALDIMMSELRTVAGLTGTTKITQVDESIFA